MAEKTHAIYERQGRARDVYDIINIGRNFREDVNAQKARISLKGKFKFKLLPEPTVQMLIDRINLGELGLSVALKADRGVSVFKNSLKYYSTDRLSPFVLLQPVSLLSQKIGFA